MSFNYSTSEFKIIICDFNIITFNTKVKIILSVYEALGDCINGSHTGITGRKQQHIVKLTNKIKPLYIWLSEKLKPFCF